MADLHQLPSMEDVEREASEWIARLNADDASVEDRALFEAWRKAHPRNARAYEELSVTWQKFSDAGHLVRAVALGQVLNASTQQAIRRSKARAIESEEMTAEQSSASEPRAERHVRRNIVLLATAASLAILLFGGTWWLGTLLPRTLFQTAIGEHASIELPDGSFLELNSNSRARVDYTEEARVIRLERGEAFFEVQHDTTRPFWVLAGRSWIRAVGTAFNIHVRDSSVRVTVSEGTVKIASSPAGGSSPNEVALAAEAVAVLNAGEQVDVRGAATEMRALPPVEIDRVIAWRTGTLSFENKSLGDVVDELSRYTTLRIVVDDPALRDMPIGGKFQAAPKGAETLLTLLQDGLGLHVRRDGRTAYIESPAPTP